MKILITGANGTIGSDLANFFSKKNKVYALYRTPNFVLKKIKNRNLKWIKHDLKNTIKSNISPNVIIHCAVTHPFSKNYSYLDYLNSNVIALKNTIEFANKKEIKYFFYLSSFKIYGVINKNIHKDCNIFNEPDLLGATKIISEKMLEMQNFNYLNIRLPGVLCYIIDEPRRPWLNLIINNFIKNKIVNVYNSNKSFNNIIDTIEIYKFINHILNKKIVKKGSLDLCATSPINIRSMINNLKNSLSSKSKINFKREKTNNYIISAKKSLNIYKFKSEKTSEIIKRYIKKFN